MRKNIKKIAIRTIFALILVLSTINFGINTFMVSYTVYQGERTLSITFPNSKYLSIRPETDFISTYEGNTVNRTFAEFSSIVKLETKGIKMGKLNPTYIQTTQQGNAKRVVTIERSDFNAISIEYWIDNIAESSQPNKDYYFFQIDYSGTNDPATVSDNIVEFTDSLCSIAIITDGTAKLKMLDGYNSFFLLKPFNEDLVLKFNILINCQ